MNLPWKPYRATTPSLAGYCSGGPLPADGKPRGSTVCNFPVFAPTLRKVMPAP
jgi:hypothetical protein